METPAISPRPPRVRRLWRILSMLTIGLVAATALVVPYVIHSAHAASPSHATSACAQPPAGKDPTTFTAAQMKMYGLPPVHPHQDKTQWAVILKHARHRVCPHLPSTSATQKFIPVAWRESVKPLSAANPLEVAATCWYSCVAGLIDPGADPGTSFTYVWSYWQIPCASVIASSPSADIEWAGMGIPQTGGIPGSGGNQVSAGVVEYTAYDDQTTPPTPYPAYQAFVQNVGYTAYPWEWGLFGVNCGDWMYTEVDAPNFMYIWDTTSGDYNSEIYGPSADTSQLGCLVQDPQYEFLMDFGSMTFNDCQAADTSGKFGGLTQWGFTTAGIRTTPSHYMANVVFPLNYSLGGFTVKWDAYN
jgi:hypothetical protein